MTRYENTARSGLLAAAVMVACGCGGKLLGENAIAPFAPEDAGPVAAQPGAGSSSSGSTSSCDASGGWAFKLVADVSWGGTGPLLGGTGTVVLWALLDAQSHTDSLTVTLLPCGSDLPDFQSILGETYGLSFPATLFDRSPPYLVPTSTTVSAASASFSLPVEATLLGLKMAHPATDPWSATPAGVDEVDMDVDMKPGVTALAKTESGYELLPVAAALTPARADELYMALRSVATLTSPIANCTQASGSADVTLDSHVLGCHLAAGGECSASQAAFAEENRTVFVVSSATFQSAKLRAAGTCQQVRAALP
jgi:hypothetical protein